ncbi:MAG: Holliday junction branch migration protein RuvA [Bilifractor sp.]|jgi:Holliday junction DNA helicase RuvA|nr:Holliday junction branch migration protein RuvA [Lachnospiraceae bacterium]
MIGFIRGTVDEIMEDSLIIDNNGMGWQIYVPGSLLDGNIHQGDEVKLYTYLSVSENAIGLYGFFTRDDLEVFRMLLNVSGIGPKGALGVLGALGSDNLRFAVLADDAAAIAKAPGIGKKTAQKIVLELKDKFALDDAFEKKLAHVQQNSSVSAGEGSAADDAVQALIALGYSGTEALQAVKKADISPEMDTEAVLKAALRHLSL